MFFSSTNQVSCYYLIDNPRKLSWLVNELEYTSEFAFDIETNHPTIKSKKKPPNFIERVCGMSFSWGRSGPVHPWEPGSSAYIPLTRGGSDFWGSRQNVIIQTLKNILESDISKVAQYGKFDVHKLCRFLDIKVRKFDFDVGLAHSLIDEERLKSSHALKSDFNKKGKISKYGMSDVYLQEGTSSFKNDLEAALNHYDPDYRRYSKVPLDILYPYGCSDTDYTLALKYVFEPILKQEGMEWLFHNITMKLQHELVLTELHGMPLDLYKAREIGSEQEKIMKDCFDEAFIIHDEKFDLASATQIGRILFETLGLDGGKRNKTGWVTDSEALEKIDHPLIDVILKFRRAQKIYGSFIVPALEGVEEVTDNNSVGWVHMTYYPDSLTGRLKGSAPNLTALPRPENGGIVVKSAWAGGEEYRFIFKDYSQIELRFIAHCSGEPVWIEGFKAGYDMHAAMAQKIWHPDLSVDEVKKNHEEDRSNAKAVNFGIAFGKSIWTLSQDLNISYEEAEKLVNQDYFGAAPVLKNWIDDMHEFVRLNGYVNNIFGRRRHLPNAQLEVPTDVYWPKRNVRSKCYRKGPNLEYIGLRYEIDKWEEFVNSLNDKIVSECIRNKNNSYFFKCLSCSHMCQCLISTEVKRINGLINQAMRQAVNSPIQGGASDMINLAWIYIGNELRNQRLDASVVLNVHDELNVYSHISCIEQASKIMDYYMCENMERITQFSVPLVVDTEIVHRWSDKYATD